MKGSKLANFLLPYTFITIISVFCACKTIKMPSELLGYVTESELRRDTSCAWYRGGDHTYLADTTLIKVLRESWSPENEYLVFAGCWCSDTKKILPVFKRVVELAGIPESKVRFYLLDLNKTSPDRLEKKHAIEYVPTIILLESGKEKGRIVEKLNKSMEADLVALFGR